MSKLNKQVIPRNAKIQSDFWAPVRETKYDFLSREEPQKWRKAGDWDMPAIISVGVIFGLLLMVLVIFLGVDFGLLDAEVLDPGKGLRIPLGYPR